MKNFFNEFKKFISRGKCDRPGSRRDHRRCVSGHRQLAGRRYHLPAARPDRKGRLFRMGLDGRRRRSQVRFLPDRRDQLPPDGAGDLPASARPEQASPMGYTVSFISYSAKHSLKYEPSRLHPIASIALNETSK